MRLVTFGENRVGKVVDDTVVDVTHVLGNPPAPEHGGAMIALIRHWDAVRTGVEAVPSDGAVGLGSVQLQAPVPRPGKIAAAPVNYEDHKEEMKQTGHVQHLGVFLKANSSVLAPGGAIQLPYRDRRFDHEGELAVVVGRRARDVAVDEALGVVFGYTNLLDITMRGGEDRSTRKSFDTFTPMGPWIVTADEFGDPSDADLRCTVNGVVRQQASTSALIWGVDRLVSYVSSVMTLEPGDVISTGTPAGVGPIEAGDEVSVTVSKIGSLTVRVAADRAGLSPTLGAGHGPQAPPPPPR